MRIRVGRKNKGNDINYCFHGRNGWPATAGRRPSGKLRARRWFIVGARMWRSSCRRMGGGAQAAVALPNSVWSVRKPKLAYNTDAVEWWSSICVWTWEELLRLLLVCHNHNEQNLLLNYSYYLYSTRNSKTSKW